MGLLVDKRSRVCLRRIFAVVLVYLPIALIIFKGVLIDKHFFSLCGSVITSRAILHEKLSHLESIRMIIDPAIDTPLITKYR